MRQKLIVLLALSALMLLPGRIVSAADESTAEELRQLEELKAIGAISQEEYEFLHSSLTGVEDEGLYTLTINKRRAPDFYRTKNIDGKIYFPIFSFFNSIGHTSIHRKDGRIFIYLENDQDMVDLNLLGDSVTDRKKEKTSIKEGENYILEGDEVYLEKALFEKLFLTSLSIDESKLEIDAAPAFTTHGDQLVSLNIQQDKLNDQKEIREVVYSNSRKLWELGYLRTDLMWSKEKKNDYNWESQLEYQGAFLYGEIITGYDVRNKEWNDTSLRYADVWNNHTLELWRYNSNEKGISFKKNKGYYWNGKRYIIRENVPIGSTVELQYMGTVIDIKKAENGEVVFDSSEIRENRTYNLRIFTPQGEVLMRPIQTLKDFNQQSKNDIEYNLDIRERRESRRYETNLETFYGITDHLTLGTEFMRSPELTEDKGWQYLDEAQLELIYSDRIKSYPYVLSAGYGKAMSLYDNKSSYDLMGEISIRDWNISAEMERFGNYYDEKITRNFELTYNPPSFYSIGYEYIYQEDYENRITEDNRLKLSLTYSHKDFLTTFNYNTSTLNLKNEFDLNMYYNGFDNFSVIFNNTWYDRGEGLESKLAISNNKYYGPVDYTLEFKYSEADRGVLSFKFEVKLDNWLQLGAYADKKGGYAFGMGVDRTIDLRDMRHSVESMDTSRVKVTAFLDSNNNGILDRGEEKLEDVKIKLGSQEMVTNTKGEAYFYGVPNSIRYNLDIEPPRPTHTIGKIKYMVAGRGNSTIDALIPIKNFKDLTGTLILSSSLASDDAQKEKIYENIIVELLDKKGKVVEITSPDEMGDFTINSLLDKEYTLSIKYNGQEYDVQKFNKKIAVTDEPLFFNFDGKAITLESEGDRYE